MQQRQAGVVLGLVHVLPAVVPAPVSKQPSRGHFVVLHADVVENRAPLRVGGSLIRGSLRVSEVICDSVGNTRFFFLQM